MKKGSPLRIENVYVSYSEYSNSYSATVKIGNKKHGLEFKLNDTQTRAILYPMVEQICNACAVTASGIREEVLAILDNTEKDSHNG